VSETGELAGLMGRNEYARHRGCAPNAVKKAEDDGRIAAAVRRTEAGDFVGIDWKLADTLWARNTDPAELVRNGKTPVSAVAPETQEPDLLTPPSAVGEKDGTGYLSARADRERFAAERARLDLLERLGLLVSSAEQYDRLVTAHRRMRDNLMLIAPRVSQRLAAETDPLRIEAILNETIRNHLNELSRAFAVDAAGGAG